MRRARINPLLTALERLHRIAELIEQADERCLAHDGPVGRTCQELTDAEFREIYSLAIGTHTRRRKKS